MQETRWPSRFRCGCEVQYLFSDFHLSLPHQGPGKQNTQTLQQYLNTKMRQTHGTHKVQIVMSEHNNTYDKLNAPY